ncbi:hypothetical protein IQ07DRAFT_30466 [Pyrenochaeta sp. DS3sAY3a]|nr:hypothetical protein IQ07DRAFT_30466 [Pyrenochaeta sp. DS3sAY3a]
MISKHARTSRDSNHERRQVSCGYVCITQVMSLSRISSSFQVKSHCVFECFRVKCHQMERRCGARGRIFPGLPAIGRACPWLPHALCLSHSPRSSSRNPTGRLETAKVTRRPNSCDIGIRRSKYHSRGGCRASRCNGDFKQPPPKAGATNGHPATKLLEPPWTTHMSHSPCFSTKRMN